MIKRAEKRQNIIAMYQREIESRSERYGIVAVCAVAIYVGILALICSNVDITKLYIEVPISKSLAITLFALLPVFAINDTAKYWAAGKTVENHLSINKEQKLGEMYDEMYYNVLHRVAHNRIVRLMITNMIMVAIVAVITTATVIFTLQMFWGEVFPMVMLAITVGFAFTILGMFIYYTRELGDSIYRITMIAQFETLLKGVDVSISDLIAKTMDAKKIVGDEENENGK